MKKLRLTTVVFTHLLLLGSLFQTSLHVEATKEKPMITEENQHVVGDSLRHGAIKKMKASSTFGIPAGETGLPAISFIDVSSNNGTITTEEFMIMKKYGVKGVAVKLTEGDSYRNPLAKQQIAAASEAGLKVSAYHYSWFNEEKDTRDEANYFSDYAKDLGLSQSTIMINDVENPSMAVNKAQENSIIFTDQLNKNGYDSVKHYSSASWFTSGTLNQAALGYKNTWVAEWPMSPSENNLLHTNSAAWQWASDIYFPELGEQRLFDGSVDYTGEFTK